MINPKLKAGCGILTLFALGFGTGAISLLMLIIKTVPLSEGWKSEDSKTFVTKQIANRLELTEAQRAEIRPIVDEALEKRWELRRDYLLEDQRLMRDVFLPRVDPLLTEEQRVRARKMLDRWRKDQRFKLADPENPRPSGQDTPAGDAETPAGDDVPSPSEAGEEKEAPSTGSPS